jgi:hypothetical protein
MEQLGLPDAVQSKIKGLMKFKATHASIKLNQG